ncbi:hypothetical protein BC351_23795 [Paenibacillus ferrarius]|uniref:Uncharacterized protein n=1 Tax=Paenibacillus ferrarius TaxID=1469647 RepID=A0A1V4HLM7_9BACL|nr:hypothetical protein BC351_23795 [Paenibacillus ferrarius]
MVRLLFWLARSRWGAVFLLSLPFWQAQLTFAGKLPYLPGETAFLTGSEQMLCCFPAETAFSAGSAYFRSENTIFAW